MQKTANYGFLKIEDDDFFSASHFAEMMDAVDEQLKIQENKTDNAAKTAIAKRVDITIPTAGWSDDTETGGTYPLYTDIALDNVTEDMIPVLTILPAGLNIARNCMLCSTVKTISGALRVYSKKVPSEEIRGSLTLICIVTASGDTISVESLSEQILASNSDAQEAMPEIFGDTKG